jgi:hypothetical protein
MADPLDLPSHPRRASGVPLTPPPCWDGSDPAGRTILVRCVSGDAECVRLARYLPLLAGRRADVLLDCPPSLARLLARLPGVRLHGRTDPSPPADAQVTLDDLPRLFGTTPATVPTFGAYLRPAPALLATWRERLRPARGGPRPYLVGLAENDAVQPQHRGRSQADADPLAALALTPAVQVVWLRRDAAIVRTRHRPVGVQIGDVDHALTDVADTAAVIAPLDLVIATDPLVAQVAGACGKPAWALLPFGADWCGCAAGDDTPWYPSMRLFRQTIPGDWSDVSAAVSEALRARLAEGTSVAA